MGIRLPGQQRVWIGCGAMGLVVELDAAEVAFGMLLLHAFLGTTKALARDWRRRRWIVLAIIRLSEAWEAQGCSSVPSTEKAHC